MFFKIKSNIILAVILCFCIIAFAVADKNTAVPASAKLSERPKIIIDAGHGGFDGGAVAVDGTIEKDINLNIALQVGEMLSISGMDVIYTRTQDTGTENNRDVSIRKRKVSDLNNRLALMSKYPESIFVSVHLNKFTTSDASGAQVFYSKSFDEAKDLSVLIQNSIVSLIQPQNTRVVKQGTSSALLLYKAMVPAVIVECGFLSNNNELKLLKTEKYQKQMAFAIFCGILNFYLK